MSSTAITELPEETLLKVFNMLPVSDRLTCQQVCKAWNELLEQPGAWSTVVFTPLKYKLSNQALESMGSKLSAVHELDLRGCFKLDSSAIASLIANSGNVRSLSLVGLTSVKNTLLSVIGDNCPKLAYLDVSQCTDVTGTGLVEMAKGCQELEYLGLRAFSHQQRFSNFAKSDVCLPKLATLDISSSQIGLVDLKHLTPERFPSLGKLEMFFAASVANLAIESVTTHFKLWSLDISMCLNVSDDGMTSLATSPCAQTLQYLDLGGCHRITPRGIEVVTLCCAQMRWFFLDDVPAVNDDCMVSIAGNMKLLKRLDVRNCSMVSDEGATALAKGCPDLRLLDVENTSCTKDALEEAFNGSNTVIKL